MKKVLTLALLLSAATAAHGEIYTWRDGRGTAHYTNSLHEIPARYLGRAKLLDVASGKKMPIGSAPQVARSAAAQAGSPPLATPVPPAAPMAPVPPGANGVIPTATAPLPAAPAPAAVATMPQPQPNRGSLRRSRRGHSRESNGEDE
jgi:hypothetical protein